MNDKNVIVWLYESIYWLYECISWLYEYISWLYEFISWLYEFIYWLDEFTFLSAKKESNSDNLSSNKETEVNIEEKPNPTEQPEDDLPF